MAPAGQARSSDPDFKSAHDWHIYYVYHDPDFIAEVEALKELEKKSGASPELDELQKDIAARYLISPYDVFRYRIGEIIYLEHETSTAALDIDPYKKEFSIRFGPYTTRPEILEQWEKFDKFRAEMFPIMPTKRRAPQQPALIYAIFKCRQRNKTFREIFKQYQDGELPGYTGSCTQYKDQKKLEEHYNKFKPGT